MIQEKGLNQPEEVRDRKSAKAFGESQRFLEELVETAGNLIVLTDPEGRIVLFNRACEELTGYKREEVFGKTIPELFLPPEWVPVVQKRFADPYAREVRAPHENPWRTKSGEERIIEWRCAVIPSPEDGRPCVLGTGTDITERKRMEEEIKSLARFPSENPNPILRLDRRGTVLAANEASKALLQDWGSGIGQVAPKSWRDLATDALSTGQSRNIDIEFGGKSYTFLVKPVMEADYVNLYGRDITERKRAEEKLRTLHKHATQLILHPFALSDVYDDPS